MGAPYTLLALGGLFFNVRILTDTADNSNLRAQTRRKLGVDGGDGSRR